MYNSMIFMNFTDMCIHHHKPVLEYFNYSVDNSYLLTVSSCFHPSPSECVCVCVFMLSHFSYVQLFATPWTVARQAPLSMEILLARILEWVAMLFSRGSSQPRDGT